MVRENRSISKVYFITLSNCQWIELNLLIKPACVPQPWNGKRVTVRRRSIHFHDDAPKQTIKDLITAFNRRGGIVMIHVKCLNAR